MKQFISNSQDSSMPDSLQEIHRIDNFKASSLNPIELQRGKVDGLGLDVQWEPILRATFSNEGQYESVQQIKSPSSTSRGELFRVKSDF